MDDPVAVALEAAAQGMLVLGIAPAAALRAAHGVRSKLTILGFFDSLAIPKRHAVTYRVPERFRRLR